MRISPNRYVAALIIGFVIASLAYVWFIRSFYFELLLAWSKQNIFLLLASLLILKVIGILWPPVPAGLITLGVIPVIGWTSAYLVDATGSIIGCSVAYFIGKKLGDSFLEKIFDSKTINRIRSLRVKKEREIEAVFALRILSGGLLFEAICYGAGL